MGLPLMTSRRIYAPGFRKDIDDLSRLDAQLDQRPSDFGDGFLELDVADKLVIAHLEVIPFLLFRGFLSVDRLLDVLFLCVNADDVSPAHCRAVAMGSCCVCDDVRHGINAGAWLCDELVLVNGESTDTTLSLCCRGRDVDRTRTEERLWTILEWRSHEESGL